MLKTLIYSVLLMILAAPLQAQRQTSPSLKKEEQKPDYSRSAVLQVFIEDLQMSGERRPFDAGYTVSTPTTRFHWIPFVMPFTFGTGAEDVSLNPYVDPFALTGTSFPYTAGSYRDRLGDWRTRRMLRKNVEAANRADND